VARKRNAARPEGREPIRYVHDGQTQIGLIYAAADATFEAVLISGQSLGTFKTARLASSAICAAAHSECAP
jgi:hypothetical protein